METLVSYLRGVGISRFDVDSALYSPETSGSRARPDRAEALCKAHQASAHDAWFNAQVQIALHEADDPETHWVPNETAKISWTKKRNELATRIAAGASD
jgi:hypothetical protein